METWTNLSLTEGNLAFYMMVFSIESIEKLNHREHGDALKKNARQHSTTDLSDFMVLDGHSRITILRDRFKDIKFVKSANARLRMNQEKDLTRLLWQKLRSRTQQIFCQAMLNRADKPYTQETNGRCTVTNEISLD